MPETRKYTVVDLFAGVGGLSYGFSRNDRFEIILANEMQKDIAKAYTLNHPAVNMLQGDIKNLSENVLRQTIGNRTVDVVVGGPPCQSYSTLGKRQMDARANLFMEYKRVLCILHPRAFLFENVKGILSMDKGALFEHVRKEFEDIGYSLQYKILNAVDYGVPQLRERVILVGFLGENPFQYPEPTHGEGLLPYVTLHDALKDLPAQIIRMATPEIAETVGSEKNMTPETAATEYNYIYFRYNNQWVTNKLISYEVVDDGQNIKFTVEGNSVASYYTSMANVVLMHKDENNTRTQNIYEKLAEGTTYG